MKNNKIISIIDLNKNLSIVVKRIIAVVALFLILT